MGRNRNHLCPGLKSGSFHGEGGLARGFEGARRTRAMSCNLLWQIDDSSRAFRRDVLRQGEISVGPITHPVPSYDPVRHDPVMSDCPK